MKAKVTGFQHIGIGVENHEESLVWFRRYFGWDIPFFNSVAEAPLMQHYTNNEVIEKRAAMIFSLRGGAAAEILRATSFEPSYPDFGVQLGDIGINVCQVKTSNLMESFNLFKTDGVKTSPIVKTPDEKDTFFVTDNNNLWYQILESDKWFTKQKHVSGGVMGTIVGVTDMDKSLEFYSGLMGYDKVLYDETGVFEDFRSYFPHGNGKYRRVCLTQSNGSGGNWGELAGYTQIELIQCLERKPVKIFKGRQWADIGFVHLGFDVKNMAELEVNLGKNGHPFTCDSTNGLNMGNTRVHCVYVEDKDNTLIELIEVYKIPIVEKWGIFMDVQKRNPDKPLPSFMIKLMRFSRMK